MSRHKPHLDPATGSPLHPLPPSSAATTVSLLPCPLCRSENLQLGACWVGERKLGEQPAVRCLNCGCRATETAWQFRAAAQATRMREVLQAARNAIASLDQYALGGSVVECTDGSGVEYQYPIRDELLSHIDAALAAQPPAAPVEPQGSGMSEWQTATNELMGRPPSSAGSAPPEGQLAGRDCPGVLESDPALFNILNNALGTMHYHRLMSALNWNGYVITREPQEVRKPGGAG
jgi:hypothetical protein